MKNTILKIFLIIILFFTNNKVFSQANLLESRNLSLTHIDDISDHDIIAFKTKLTQISLSEEKAYEILQVRGLPSDEIEKLKIRVSALNHTSIAKVKNSVEKENNNVHQYDSTQQNVSMELAKKDLSIFGSELFLKSSLVFEPNIRIATPSSYVVGPDDEIIVNVYGLSEMKYNLEVNENGEVYIPSVGPIYVNGFTLDQAAKKIKTKLASTIYRAISSGQTKVHVGIGKIRSIRATVIGEAYKSGTFTVSSLTTLYNLLYLCGGPSDMGSYRQIEIIRGNQIVRKADLYDFLIKGDQKDNILLQEGDVVRIPFYNNRVSIEGNVKRPGKYEMLEGEKFENLLAFSGGFDEMAYKGAVSVVRIAEKERKVIDVDQNSFSAFSVNAGDEYFVSKLSDEVSNKIVISGAVYRPGNYEPSSGLSLKSLIEKAGGIKDDAFTERVNIYRLMKGNLPSVFSVNLDSVLKNGLEILLQKGDSITVYSIYNFKDNQVVTIQGNVRKPGRLKWRENLTIKELLPEAGGINEFGDSTTIEISRRKKSADFNSRNYYETETFFVNLSSSNNSGSDITLMPYDIVNVKVIPGIINQRTIVILGEVKTPGKYNLQKTGDKISDIIHRSGGFKASADSSSLIIRRKRKSTLTITERENLFQRLLNIDTDSLNSNQQLKNELYNDYDLITVDLSSALSDTAKYDNLYLEDGDILTIDKNNKLVKVSGEVFYPTIIPIRSRKNAKYYVKQAGGFMPSSRKSKTLIIYPNGKVLPVRSFLWFNFYPKITSRAEIFVPQKNKDNKNRLGTGELALIVSALGILANVVLTAVKN